MRALVLMCLLSSAHSEWYKPGHAPPEPTPGSECTADPTSCGCCVMQREVNRLKTSFNMSLQMLEMEFMQTNKSLSSIISSRSAFSAVNYSMASASCSNPLNNNTIIIYKSVLLNLGGDYNNMTGIYTVPQPGVYVLIVTMFDSGAAGNSRTVCVSLQVNNKAIVYAKDTHMLDSKDSATTVVALQLEAEDQVSVMMAEGCALCQSDGFYNTFTVFLLYPTS